MDREAWQAAYSSWGHNELDTLVIKQQQHHKLDGLLLTFQIKKKKNEALDTYCLMNIFFFQRSKI